MRHIALSAAAITALSLSVVPISAATAADPLTCQGLPVTIAATANDQVVEGTAGDDVISTAGFDRVTINAVGGNDVICLGDSQSPVVDAGDGDDKVYAETSSTPKVAGGAGDDLIEDRALAADPLLGGELSGGEGNDTISVTSRTTVARGGAGNDKITVAKDLATNPLAETGRYPTVLPGAGDDTVDGGGTAILSFADATGPISVDLTAGKATGDGTDTLTNVQNVVGSPAADTIVGTDAANDIEAGTGDTVDAKGGDDVIRADGAKSVVAGAGNDTITAVSSTVDAGDGNDTITATSSTVDAGSGDDVLTLTSSKAKAGNGNDTITATKSTVDAGSGNDTITQNGGTTDGGWGSDVIEVVNYGTARGGPGKDVLRATQDAAPEKAGQGVRLFGDAGRDRIVLWSSARKKAGDRLNGGPGKDTLDLRTLDRGTIVDLEAGRVTLRRTAQHSRWIRVPARDFQAVQGSKFNDRIYGTSGADRLRGNGGRDVLYGRAGADHLHGGKGRDVAYGGAGNDTCTAVEVRHSC